MNTPLFWLLGLLALPAAAQRGIDPWLDALHPLPAAVWLEHSGPSPGWTSAQVWLRRSNLSGGAQLTPLGLQGWMMSDVAWKPRGRTKPESATAGGSVRTLHRESGRVGLGLGWDGQAPQILAHAVMGPWTAQCIPLRGTWAVSWRQRQTSGWMLLAHANQDLRAQRTEWIVGLEKPGLGLYASSLGRWRVVYRRGALRIALGGGQTAWSSLGFQTGTPP
ncbi:MAG: hypothetical protein ACO3BA_04815 [Schleiferiaceae bacterium]